MFSSCRFPARVSSTRKATSPFLYFHTSRFYLITKTCGLWFNTMDRTPLTVFPFPAQLPRAANTAQASCLSSLPAGDSSAPRKRVRRRVRESPGASRLRQLRLCLFRNPSEFRFSRIAMSFISYAQNHEDVMLYRALREVNQGFYIDVGAQDPVIDSVTKAFYERGWRGINIEPNEEYFRKLLDDRPHDVNLLTAVGREPGAISFYEVVHTGLSTTSAVYARRHEEAGYEVHLRNVPCTTLDRICTDCGVETVHFLKIDVEGSERAVLEGFSFGAVRPWVVVVEATEPNSNREVSAEWEDLLVRRSYQFVYFDGLNRFYVAGEHADLAGHFSCPPNPFDQYVSYHLWWARGELEQAQAAERNALVNSLNHVLAEAESLRNGITERDRQIDSLRNTTVERDRQIDSLRNTTVERDRQIDSLQTPPSSVTGRSTAYETPPSSVTGRSTAYETPPSSVTGRSKRFEARWRQLSAGYYPSVHPFPGGLRARCAKSDGRQSVSRVSSAGFFADQHALTRSRGPSNIATPGLAVSDEIAAGLRSARSLYRALRETVSRKP